MSRTKDVKYSVIFIDNFGHEMQLCQARKISAKNAENYIRDVVKSFEHGGVNFHISQDIGYVPYPKQVLFKMYDTVYHEWNSPLFYVW